VFEEVGHHVEKIKRVQLGPLVLDVELGKFRELKEREIEELKRAANGGKGGK
jgi:23S rRNA pseudouridine2605 synthase